MWVYYVAGVYTFHSLMLCVSAPFLLSEDTYVLEQMVHKEIHEVAETHYRLDLENFCKGT